ncbi:hypothetical protein [Kibdelosporangium phytohabitans]|uniref:Uncharacterized protein n=1 Tax=Kibdelosporangium phytohabitans TaxID=860235 RepID=A0A0N9HQB0_9PSEU|nr:hypothetical protein [Kibdelosporangium phytohabitans]ALG06867.1 hypothetical protein AOZ06_07910 [Kibdelosporangium phytohabitans]MBE1468117.1 hypothetical protein [Kibdelosporangium phytohabitans]
MIADLLMLGLSIGWVPAIWIAQAICDWWTEPSRVFLRKIWRADRAEQLHHLLIRGSAAGWTACVETRPSPGSSSPGEGATTFAPGTLPPPPGADTLPAVQLIPAYGGQAKTPVGVGAPPDPAPTGLTRSTA